MYVCTMLPKTAFPILLVVPATPRVAKDTILIFTTNIVAANLGNVCVMAAITFLAVSEKKNKFTN